MRTLKKSLCLVLALVMVLGLCMIGANAEYANYTDKKEINYADAVEVLSGLGVVEGRTDGTFDPKATVTRAEACAMIARMMLGPDAANKLPVGDVKFNDVSLESWEGRMARYIAFCANRGIVVGDGNGNFRPNDPVKGTELAAMLLRALGYGAIGEYEGKGWDVNAVADALYYKVFEGSEVTDFSAKATREETALYIWNTMRVELVGYDVDLNYYDDKDGKTFAGDVFGLDWQLAKVLANPETGADYTVVDFAIIDRDGTVYYADKPENIKIETPKEYIAHEVMVYYKADVEYKDRANNYYFNAYLVQDLSTEIVPSAFSYKGDVYKNLKAGNKANDKVDLETTDMWLNYVYTTENDVAIKVADMKGRYTLFDMIMFTGLNGCDIILGYDGRIIALRSYDYTVDKVTSIDYEGGIMLAKTVDGNPYDPEYAYEGIKKGDYVSVQPVGDLTYLYPSTTEEVLITQVNDQHTSFNNSKYTKSSGYGNVYVPGTLDPDLSSVTAGCKVKFYLDYKGSYFGVEMLEMGTSDGIVFVTSQKSWSLKSENEYGETPETVYVQTVNAKGEEVVYPVVKIKGADAKANTTYTGVYSVYLDSKGNATLVEAKDSALPKGTGNTSISANGGVYYVNSDTTVYYVNYKNEKKSSIEITKSSSIKGADSIVYVDAVGANGGYNIRTAWVLGKAPADTAEGSYIFVPYFLNMYGPYTGFTQVGGLTDVNDDDIDDFYGTFYKDGVSTSNMYVDSSNVFDLGTIDGTYYGNVVFAGFYTYTQDKFDVYTLTGVPTTGDTGVKDITKTLTSGMLNNGKLFIGDADAYADGVSLADINLVNVSSATTPDGGRYLNINDFDAITDLLADGYSVVIRYVAARSATTESWIPQGTIYVLSATAPAPAPAE